MSKSASSQMLQTVGKDLTSVPSGILQRKCASCSSHTIAGGKCDECKNKKGALQRKSSNSSEISEVPPIVHEVLRSSGQPLDESTRAFFEPRFGYDFSKVRVHTDTKAAQSAQAVNALAYTIGNDIVFGAGQYSRASGDKHLLAHELVHTIQQSKGANSKQLSAHSLSISHPNDSFEKEAEAVANSVLAGTFIHPKNTQSSVLSRRTAPIIQRQASEKPPEAAEQSSNQQQQSWTHEPEFGPPVQMPLEEAARRVNSALDVITGLTYVRRPPAAVAAASPSEISSESETTAQAFPANVIQRTASNSSRFAGVHAGVVGSIQVCWDVMSGEGSLRGWIWAGVGYDAPVIGWVGGYFFGERTWWTGTLASLIEPGQCDPACARHGEHNREGLGIAGFPINIKPGERARLSRGGLEAGFLLTPNSLCDADLEIIVLLNVLGYLGPIATVVTRAVDGLNTLTNNSPRFELEAGIDANAAVHLCRGANRLLTINRFELCGGGYIGANIGLSHTKSENHGAS